MQGVILTSNISQPFPAVQTGIQVSLKHPSFGPKDFRIMITKYIFPQLQLCPISQLLYESSRSSSAILPCTSCWIFYCWACSRFFYLLSMLFALDRHGRLCYNNNGQNFVHTSKWRTVQLRQSIFSFYFHSSFAKLCASAHQYFIIFSSLGLSRRFAVSFVFVNK